MAHSQARELVTQGYAATLVANTLKIAAPVCITGSARDATERSQAAALQAKAIGGLG